MQTDGPGNLARFVVRLVVGGTFAVHGYLKVAGGVAGFAGFLAGLHFPAAGLLAWVVALLELVGGLALVAGALTRPVAALFAAEMVVTTFWVKIPRGVGFIGSGGTGWELDVVLLGGAVALVLLGAGTWSVDHLATPRSSGG